MILSFCTTCMDRLHHLKYTLPTNIEVADWLYPEVEFILVDYNSQDGLEAWVKGSMHQYLECGILKYYKTNEPEYFQMSHAKNTAHKLASGDILCNLDADNFLSVEFIETILKLFEKEEQIVIYGTGGANGKVCVTRDNFLKLGGYNEQFEGWGVEDLDFLRRASAFLELKQAELWQFDWNITHDNEDRVRKTKSKDLQLMWNHNSSIADENFKKGIYVANENSIWGEVSLVLTH
jgi:predicted glycosyltransferase involved in capsule biosynthesis